MAPRSRSNRDGACPGFIYITLAIFISFNGLAEARDKGDDIILTKGKIIMRGGKGKGK